jgi:hypothetical protein
LEHPDEPDPNHEVSMARANANNTTNTPVAQCELSLRLRLRKFGMRLERDRFGYRLLAGDQVLLSRGAGGFGLSLYDIVLFIDGALQRRGAL